MAMLVDEDKLLGKVDNLWNDLEFILVDTLRYSGYCANLVGYSKIFEVSSKFLVDILFSQFRHSGGGDM